MINTHTAVLVLALGLGLWYYFKVPNGREILADKVGKEYDYVIVGGGSAGAVLASRLSEDKDTTVLLLEAGGFYDENPNFHIPAYFALLLKSEHDWGFYSTPQRSSSQGLKAKQAYLPRGRVLGGSSTINAMLYVRGSPFDYDEWAAMGCEGWEYKDVLPYFLKSEDIQIPDLKSSKYHSSGGLLGVSSGRFTPLADKYLKAGQEMGYDITDYNSADLEGFSEIQLTVRNGVRASTGLAFLAGTTGRDNLHISVKSFVTKVLIKEKKADGVFFIKDNRKKFVRARKEVILSAGAINSPQLLMLSGIGPKTQLSKMGINVIADLPVGKNLQDHQMVCLGNKIKEPLSNDPGFQDSLWNQFQYRIFGRGPMAFSGVEANAFFYTDKSMKGKISPDIMFMFGSYLFTADFFNIDGSIVNDYIWNGSNPYGFTTCVVLAHPKSTGTIRLKSTDSFDYPIIDPTFFMEKEDVETMIAGIRILENFLQTKTMKQLGVDLDDLRMVFCSQYKFRSDEYWECVIRHISATVYHHSGTCKMGADDDATAVLDTKLKVRGIKGLRVVDASVFPKVTSGNINAPVIMVAEKAADLIRNEDTVEYHRRNLA